MLQQAAAEGRDARVRIVAYCKLSQLPEAGAVLSAHRAVAGDKLVGVRMILNHAAGGPSAPGGGEDDSLTWPQVERGDFLTGGVPAFAEGFALLAKHGSAGGAGLSFDLQCNWFQLADAAAFLQAFPETVVVLDHMGCLKLTGTDAAEDAARIAEWRRGMGALAALPNVHVKLSMLECVTEWTGLGSMDVNVQCGKMMRREMWWMTRHSESAFRHPVCLSIHRYVRQGWMVPGSAAHGVVKGLVREVSGPFSPFSPCKHHVFHLTLHKPHRINYRPSTCSGPGVACSPPTSPWTSSWPPLSRWSRWWRRSTRWWPTWRRRTAARSSTTRPRACTSS